MEEEKKLYPFQFIQMDENTGEYVHIADLGYQDSLVSKGWLAANSIAEIMDMYLDRIVGQHVFDYYGRQFPVLVKHYDGSRRSPLLVHPDDELSEQRFDFLGKAKLWYVTSVKPGAKLYLGFKKDVDAAEFYMACRHFQVEDILNEVEPKPGESYFIRPGLVHALGEGVGIVEIAESSPLDFRLFDWGREFEGDEFDAELNLDEALDFIDYKKYCSCGHHHCEGECHCHDEQEHCHEEDCHCSDAPEDKMVKHLTDCEEFAVTRLELSDALHIYTSNFDSYVLYTCVSGEAMVQLEEENEKGEKSMKAYTVKQMETILVPAEISDIFLVPAAAGTVLLETISPVRNDADKYINPDADPELHDACFCDDECDDGEDECDDEQCDCHHHRHHLN